MKLLFILPEYLPHSGGGIITFYRTLLPQLAAMGHEVRVIVGSGLYAEESHNPVEIDGVKVESLSIALRDKYHDQFQCYAAMPWLRRHLAAAWAMHEQAGSEHFDLVEASDWGLLFIPWALEQKLPLVVRMHGSTGQIDIHDPVAGEESQSQLVRLIELEVLKYASALQTLSDSNASFWQQQTGCSVERIYPAWKPTAKLPENLKRSDRGLVVGRLQRWKGPHILCEALQLLDDQSPAIDWLGRDTAFDSRHRRTSQYLAENYPSIWQQKLLHCQPESPDQVATRQASAAFVVVPSTWDVFNFTCVEAMGQGTPVICSTGAGASSLIQDGINGFIFENETPRTLADAILRCTSMSDEQRAIMGKAALATVTKLLNPSGVARQQILAYESAIKKPLVALSKEYWVFRACAPSNKTFEPLAFLDHLPLKQLSRYLMQRAKKKYLP